MIVKSLFINTKIVAINDASIKYLKRFFLAKGNAFVTILPSMVPFSNSN